MPWSYGRDPLQAWHMHIRLYNIYIYIYIFKLAHIFQRSRFGNQGWGEHGALESAYTI